jgi:hypothetical protein
MRRLLTQFLTAIGSLAAACLAMLSPLAAARRCALELAERRGIVVQTVAITEGRKHVVLQTRIRIFGDTQTDDGNQNAPPHAGILGRESSCWGWLSVRLCGRYTSLRKG